MKTANIFWFVLFLVLYTLLIHQIFPSVNYKIIEYKQRDSTWNEIGEYFGSVTLMNPQIIIKTLKFQRDEVDEYDKELIEFVRSLIVPPSKKELNIYHKGSIYFSQIGQDKYMDELLKQKEFGFYIEAGALDGETFSNTLFFEIKRNWTGLLIEPIPDQYEAVVSKNRNAYVINACISGGKPFVTKFRRCAVPSVSGIPEKMSQKHLNMFKNECSNSKYFYVPCFSLSTILYAINVTNVDYFSLDVEGNEWNILKDFNFNRYSIKSFSIEYAGVEELGTKITDYLEKYNYTRTKKDVIDIYFMKK
jgi:hypothetical protein